MSRKTSNKKAFWFEGYKIVYSIMDRRWFVEDWDMEGYCNTLGPSHPSKYAAMDWCCKHICGE